MLPLGGGELTAGSSDDTLTNGNVIALKEGETVDSSDAAVHEARQDFEARQGQLLSQTSMWITHCQSQATMFRILNGALNLLISLVGIGSTIATVKIPKPDTQASPILLALTGITTLLGFVKQGLGASSQATKYEERARSFQHVSSRVGCVWMVTSVYVDVALDSLRARLPQFLTVVDLHCSKANHF